MAVVVQRLVAADVAGVLFTADPQNGWHREMLLEASWGLGEAVVSGRVQPDALRLDGVTGKVLATAIADKHVRFTADAREIEAMRIMPPAGPVLADATCTVCGNSAGELPTKWDRRKTSNGPSTTTNSTCSNRVPIATLQDAEAYEELLRNARTTSV